ncbi:MAG: helix-turn-helix domain-containing protein [Nitriliruptoraceae bacterium]|nr:helix-turn-helix domain-containing protein [Nitriliruptoraceae bacterium]
MEARFVELIDNERGTPVAAEHPHLADAVRTFAEAGFSVSEAGRRLEVHANTVAYRLDRWEELTGWDPAASPGSCAASPRCGSGSRGQRSYLAPQRPDPNRLNTATRRRCPSATTRRLELPTWTTNRSTRSRPDETGPTVRRLTSISELQCHRA